MPERSQQHRPRRRHRRLILLLSSVAFLASCAGTDDYPGLLEGQSARDAGVPTSVDEAKSWSQLMQVAETTARNGELGTAAMLYKRAYFQRPEEPEPLRKMGAILLALNAPLEASEAYKSLLAINEGDAEARLGLGRSLIALNRPYAASLQFKRVIDLQPDNISAIIGLGVSYDLMGDHDRAQEAFRSGLALAPGNGSLLNNLGHSLTRSGRFDEAIQVLQVVVDLPGTTVRHRHNLALAYGMSGKLREAAEMMSYDLDESSLSQNLAYFRSQSGTQVGLAVPVPPVEPVAPPAPPSLAAQDGSANLAQTPSPSPATSAIRSAQQQQLQLPQPRADRREEPAGRPLALQPSQAAAQADALLRPGITPPPDATADTANTQTSDARPQSGPAAQPKDKANETAVADDALAARQAATAQASAAQAATTQATTATAAVADAGRKGGEASGPAQVADRGKTAAALSAAIGATPNATADAIAGPSAAQDAPGTTATAAIAPPLPDGEESIKDKATVEPSDKKQKKGAKTPAEELQEDTGGIEREDREEGSVPQASGVRETAAYAPRPADYSDERVSDQLVLLAELSYQPSPLPQAGAPQEALAPVENPPAPLLKAGTR